MAALSPDAGGGFRGRTRREGAADDWREQRDIGFSFARTCGGLLARFGARRIWPRPPTTPTRRVTSCCRHRDGRRQMMIEPARYVARDVCRRACATNTGSRTSRSRCANMEGRPRHRNPVCLRYGRRRYGDKLTPADEAAAKAANRLLGNFCEDRRSQRGRPARVAALRPETGHAARLHGGRTGRPRPIRGNRASMSPNTPQRCPRHGRRRRQPRSAQQPAARGFPRGTARPSNRLPHPRSAGRERRAERQRHSRDGRRGTPR